MALRRSKPTLRNENNNIDQPQVNPTNGPLCHGRLLDLEDDAKSVNFKMDDNECSHCRTLSSPVWKRGADNEILCNACGLYWKHYNSYRPLEFNSNRQSCKVATPNPNSITETITIGINNTSRRNREREAKRKLKPLSANETDNESSTQLNSAKRFTTPINLSQIGTLSIPLNTSHKVQTLLHRNRILFEGDHIVIRGSDNKPYFAIIEEFKVSKEGVRQFRFSWLLPKAQFAEKILNSRSDEFDPLHYTLGPKGHDFVSVDAIVNVLYSPQREQRSRRRSGESQANERIDGLTDEGVSFFEEVAAAHYLCDIECNSGAVNLR